MKLATLLKTTAFALLLTLSLSTAKVFADESNINSEKASYGEDDENQDPQD